MNIIERHRYILRTERLREWIASFILTAPLGCAVTIESAGRTVSQNALLHGLIADAVAGGLATDDGRRLTLDEAKTAFVTGWTIENGLGSDIIAFSGRPVQLRRSTKTFDKGELSSLIDFVQFECAKRGIALRTDSA